MFLFDELYELLCGRDIFKELEVIIEYDISLFFNFVVFRLRIRFKFVIIVCFVKVLFVGLDS